MYTDHCLCVRFLSLSLYLIVHLSAWNRIRETYACMHIWCGCLLGIGCEKRPDWRLFRMMAYTGSEWSTSLLAANFGQNEERKLSHHVDMPRKMCFSHIFFSFFRLFFSTSNDTLQVHSVRMRWSEFMVLLEMHINNIRKANKQMIKWSIITLLSNETYEWTQAYHEIKCMCVLLISLYLHFMKWANPKCAMHRVELETILTSVWRARLKQWMKYATNDHLNRTNAWFLPSK